VLYENAANESRPRLRIAVVGAGPSGLFAVEELLRVIGGGVLIDVIDRLPTPYGLVRYGVAPDHPTIKSVIGALEVILESEQVRFLGGIELGAHLRVDDLRRCYDAVVYAMGAPRARALQIPGEDLPGSISATDLVAWYNGHPDAQPDVDLDAESVAVLGAGNVALDVGRLLTRDYADLARTDMPPPVLSTLRRSRVTDVHLVGRRSPEFARYSSKELRELGKLSSVDKVVYPDELTLTSSHDLDRMTKANLAQLQGWSAEAPRAGARKVHLRFSLRPAAIIGDRRVEGLVLERTTVDECGNLVGTAEFTTLEVQMIVRAVGYLGAELSGVPFDCKRGTVPNVVGRVTDGQGGPVRVGEYVTGWLKRGPSGVIGTNKLDSHETIGALVDDAPHLPRGRREPLESVLEQADHRWTTYAGWQRIDRAEIARGEAEGRNRSKISDWQALIDVAAGGSAMSSKQGSRQR
jgi:ferredoxin/flavodoxin---NADP+ reductase